LDANHETEGEKGVHERLAPLGFGLTEMAINVQRLWIERHVGEQHVVHLRHGARITMLVTLADLEIFKVQAAAFVPLNRLNHHDPPLTIRLP
jgi:hypothetical protein